MASGAYYTATQADARYVNVTGDTLTGDLSITKTEPIIYLNDSNTTTGSYPAIEFNTSNNQGVRLSHNEFDGELPVGGYGLALGPSASNTQFPSTGTLSFMVLGEIYAGATSATSCSPARS